MNALIFSTTLALLGVNVIGRASPLDTWAPRGSLPAGTDLTSIGYGDSQFVAVGAHGIILTSEDGTNWIQQQSGTTNRLSDITFGNGKFVVVGSYSMYFDDKSGGIILTSSDGVNWTQNWRDPTNGLLAIAYGNGQFLAMGRIGYTLTSADGINWARLLTLFAEGPTRASYKIQSSIDLIHWRDLTNVSGGTSKILLEILPRAPGQVFYRACSP